MAQLHDQFGSALDDPAVRTRLTLALCWGMPNAPASHLLVQNRRRHAG
jgi:hypothetical protein